MTSPGPSRNVFGEKLLRLGENIDEITTELRDQPDAVRALKDHELLALGEWTEADGGSEIIRGECRRRAGLLRRFSTYLMPDEAASTTS